jgi:NADPH-dependent glutamate synthase beta subunit-like oxidoreductase
MLAPFLLVQAHAQRMVWRQATVSELASVLPSRAQVVNEHIETEMRTASGIVNSRGQYIAGVVLLTAGYSADGKVIGHPEILTRSSTVKVRDEGGETDLEGVFAGGDIVRGAMTVVHAIRDGRLAADAMGEYMFAKSAARGESPLHGEPTAAD